MVLGGIILLFIEYYKGFNFRIGRGEHCMGEIILNNNAKVVKSFNNNILLVREKGKEKILFQKGIGFGKKPGDLIEKGIVVEKVFVIEDKENQRNFNEILTLL